MSSEVDVVKMISIRPVPHMQKVIALYPPAMLNRFFGEVPARLIFFAYIAIKERPDIIAGFHLLLNGLFAILLARLIGRNSMYICGGGPREFVGGGYKTENRIFNKLNSYDCFVENILLKSITHTDIVITMGKSALEYLAEKGVSKNKIEIIAGGFDSSVYFPRDDNKKYDLILVGRISKVKRIDIFLNAIKSASKKKEDITAVIVGDGPDANKMKELSKKLELEERVSFVGWQDNVNEWLQKSKVFVLTSESEGLSQALIQAMMVGLPAAVTNVGDLSDLVINGKNGLLIEDLDAVEFSQAFCHILLEKSTYDNYSKQAIDDTRKYAYKEVSKQWNRILGPGFK
jgi:glycosyltransferase involved in cell wall biosynthesis